MTYDLEQVSYVPHEADYNDPALNFAKIRGKWTAPPPPRKQRVPLPEKNVLALMLAPPPKPKQFKMPTKAPKKVTWQWLADQCGISVCHAHNILAKRFVNHKHAGALSAMIQKFGRPPVRRTHSRMLDGLCKLCESPRVNASFCEKHTIENRKASVEYYHKNRKAVMRRVKERNRAVREREQKLKSNEYQQLNCNYGNLQARQIAA
jgi:hypothetical protein